ncbi:hypothetical protein [Jatrophihabitans sp.]|uniref:hypothetical protein n=1 Tax=Jatrophihabitans sp. TaxID=1932789 RepID=UPI002C4E2854|nr:hypothetical protein [Jatrophihabitans sp.]
METKPAPDTDPADEVVRPRTVDLAVGAILLRCVLALAAAFALFGAKDELRREGAKLHPEWSAATLADRIDSELRSNVVLTLVYVALVLLLAKFLRDGRNWARWLFAFFAFLVAGDVLRVAGFFTGENVLFRLLSGLTGVAAVVAIVLLFSPSAGAYFRPAGSASVSPLRTLFGGRAALAAERYAAARQPADGDPGPVAGPAPVSLDKAERRPDGAASTGRAAGARPAPRAKSRKQATE